MSGYFIKIIFIYKKKSGIIKVLNNIIIIMIKNIIFDFDGVIADSTNIKTEAFVALYSQYSEETQSQVKSYHIRHSGVSRYKKIYYFQKEIV